MSAHELNTVSLHHEIMHHFLHRGFAPTSEALAKHFSASPEEMARALSALQDYHGVVLHPHRAEVWVSHPFSSMPTPFAVHLRDRLWWGSCAWCSLGIAALLGGTGVSIDTSIGVEGRPVTVHVESGRVSEKLLVHFPIPMTRVWDNVIYSDSLVLLFESEAQIDAWVNRHNIPRGDTQPIQRVYDLARLWYGRHLERDWHKWTTAEAREIFASIGLQGPTWSVPESSVRF